MNMGIIAEDESDVAVLRELTLSLVRPHLLGVKRYVGRGCGKLRRKCRVWAQLLVHQGCPWVVVVHDLDRYDERGLRRELQLALATAGAQATLVLIPKKEIEAWLLYDACAIARAFRQERKPQLPGNPESLRDPKKYLRDIVWRLYRKTFLHTVHNGQIAKHIDVLRLRRSPSFTPHFAFADSVRNTLRQQAG